ncbi:MAG: hypothetical protein E7638_07875 [Ruminococcaceae bacterium]|nr:hypothetical protein [Oscillospiraceae bacterium]
MKNGFLLVLLTAAAVMLFSCTLMDDLGFDTYDYMGEAVTATHTGDSETAALLRPILDILITDSTELPAFDNMGDAITSYRDAVLRHMLETEYTKYSGNRRLIEEAAEEYPELQITQIIPADDFEYTVYRYFGGDVKVSHKDGGVFRYLKKVEGYICNMVPADGGVEAEIISVDETERTYRVRFRCTADETTSEYTALVIKREDGTYYFKKLERA